MTTHKADAGPITLINVFEVDPGKLGPFLAGWRERAELMSKRPGFRSLRLAPPDSAGFATFTAIEEVGFTANPALYRVAFETTAP